jgi:hypothetical protein
MLITMMICRGYGGDNGDRWGASPPYLSLSLNTHCLTLTLHQTLSTPTTHRRCDIDADNDMTTRGRRWDGDGIAMEWRQDWMAHQHQQTSHDLASTGQSSRVSRKVPLWPVLARHFQDFRLPVKSRQFQLSRQFQFTLDHSKILKSNIYIGSKYNTWTNILQ